MSEGSRLFRWGTAAQAMLVLLFLAVLCGPSAAAPVPPSAPKPAAFPVVPRSLGDLIEGAQFYDGRSVTVEGEVVGEVMFRGKYAWLNLSDGAVTIGIWGSSGLMKVIRWAGNYKTRGDRVRVTGVFRRADPEQAGELAIHAATLVRLTPGGELKHPIGAGRIRRTVASLCGLFLIAAIWIAGNRRRGRNTEAAG